MSWIADRWPESDRDLTISRSCRTTRSHSTVPKRENGSQWRESGSGLHRPARITSWMARFSMGSEGESTR